MLGTIRCTEEPGIWDIEMDVQLSVLVDRYRSATESMKLHRAFLYIPAIAFALGVLTLTTGCERRYVGGPVAIVKGKPPEHGMLGVTFGQPPNALVLRRVLPGGPAFQSGIRTGDEIVALQHRTVATPEDVLSIVRTTRPGDGLVVRVRRMSEEIDFDVTLCDFVTILTIGSTTDSSQESLQRSEIPGNAE